MFRSALVALKPDRASSVISASIDFAKNFQWELGGLSVVDADRLAHGEAVPLGASAFKAERDAKQLEAARQIAVSVGHEFASACQIAGVRCESLSYEGDTVGELSRAALGFDVLICGHSQSGDVSDRALLHDILKHNARPTLVVPPDPVRGSNVVMAYDGSFQAARALATLVHSGLLTNRHLHVVCLHAEYGTAAARSVSAMDFLRRQGVSANCHPEVLVKDVADQLIEAIQRSNAGLLVMGAFGQGSVREFFFGSVTQSMLQKLRVPVLLEH